MAQQDIAIFAGQSNCGGTGSVIHLLANRPHLLTLSSDHVIWDQKVQAYNTIAPGVNCNTTQFGQQNPFHGAELNFAYNWNQATATKIHIFKHAVVGTLGNTRVGTPGLPIWNKLAGEIYTSFLAQWNASVATFPDADTINIVGFFWIQGESDIGAQNALDYYRQLLTLFADIRLDFGVPAMPFHVLRLHNKFTPASRQVQVNAIRSAQHQAVTDAADANFSLFDTDPVEYSVQLDDVHFDDDGLAELGEDLYAHTLIDSPGVGSSVLDADAPWLAEVGFQELPIKSKPRKGP